MTDKFLTDLDEALKESASLIETDFDDKTQHPKWLVDMVKAATMLRDLYPLLVQLCEARKGASDGLMNFEEYPVLDDLDMGQTYSIWGEGFYIHDQAYDARPPKIEDARFLATAANLTTEIQKILEGK